MRRWDEYVVAINPNTGKRESVRCYGPGTAAEIARSKKDQGYDNVKVIGVPSSRKKESQSVHTGRLPISVRSRYRH